MKKYNNYMKVYEFSNQKEEFSPEDRVKISTTDKKKKEYDGKSGRICGYSYGKYLVKVDDRVGKVLFEEEELTKIDV